MHMYVYIHIYISIYLYIYIYTLGSSARFARTSLQNMLWRYITADILRHARCIMADILQQIYYGRYNAADMLRKIYYGRHITAAILRTTKTTVFQQISSARSSQLLHPNLRVATHRPKNSTGPFTKDCT